MWLHDVTAYIAALAPARLAIWPALGGAGATLAATIRDGRRRTVLNEHLHELRRPLQTLALMAPRSDRDDPGEAAVEMAAAALAALEREINGGRAAGARAAVAVRPLLESARRRWRAQAALVGTGLTLRWDAGEAAVEGNRMELAAAIDNLIANALEHGGGPIELTADLAGDRICLAVVDSGRGAGRRAREREALRRGGEARRRRDAGGPFGRLTGRARHGHGLRLVRRTAARHGGAFALHRGERGTSAVLELPLAPRLGRRGPAAEPPGGRSAPGFGGGTASTGDGNGFRAPDDGHGHGGAR